MLITCDGFWGIRIFLSFIVPVVVAAVAAVVIVLVIVLVLFVDVDSLSCCVPRPERIDHVSTSAIPEGSCCQK
jgi:hypothetical protein